MADKVFKHGSLLKAYTGFLFAKVSFPQKCYYQLHMIRTRLHHTLISKYIVSNWLQVRTSHQNVMHSWYTPAVLTPSQTVPSQNKAMHQECMTNTGATEDNLVPSRPPVGGLPIAQDWLHRMKFVRSHIIPFIRSVRHYVCMLM